MKITYKNEKLSTGIYGLDKILFGGIQLQNWPVPSGPDETMDFMNIRPLTITICGEMGTSKSLLGMQLLHGLTKSLRALEKPDGRCTLRAPIYYSAEGTKENLSDMLLDMVISKCTNHIMEEHIQDSTEWSGCTFSSTVFEVEQKDNFYSLRCSELDRYIAEGKVIYNNRTNALHLMYGAGRGINEDENKIASRRHNDIARLSECMKGSCLQHKELSKNFFDVSIYTSQDNFYINTAETDKIPCLLIDNIKGHNCEIETLIPHSLVVIRIAENGKDMGRYKSDLVIRLRRYMYPSNGYQQNQLSIRRSVLQSTAQGWHLYKKMDYGFEVYPSSHLILQRRRHMGKEMLRTHYDILSETYAQYLEWAVKNDPVFSEKNDSQLLQDFENRIEERKEKKWGELVDSIGREECASNILREILIGNGSFQMHDNTPNVTAIIGEANTYKRYLTLGSTFNACCYGEDTLKILLDKEGDIMFRRIVCPAMALLRKRGKENFERCLQCYRHIHFKEIRMGCISADELFYYIIKQIRLSKGKWIERKKQEQPCHPIKRIIIDDLMKVDFSFPMLHDDTLFLTTLISICRNEGVELIILCDKSACSAHELRFQADNVICTERTSDDILLYIEKFSGYNDPSHIFGCRISKIGELFYCDDDDEHPVMSLNNKCITGISVSSMSDYWVSNDTNKFINAIKSK